MSKYSSEADVRAALLKGKSYSPSMIAGLEDYLDAACRAQAPYVFDAVRTLIKLYQIFPDSNLQNIGRCCCLAFLNNTNDDDTDLLALQYMIPSAVLQEQEPVVSVLKCSAAATACQFAAFWKAYDALLQYSADPAIAAMAQQSKPARQHAILGMLALSYQEAPTAIVLQAINVASVADLEQLQSPVVRAVSAETVTFASTADNTKRQRVFVEGATFQTVHSLLSKMAQ